MRIIRLKRFIYNLSLYLFYPCKVKKSKVVFINFGGKGYGDNPKYIAEDIIRKGKKWDLVWFLNDLNEDLPKEIRKVKFRSLKMRYEMQTAKVIVTNCQAPISIIKKNNQYIIQTWHAPMSYKKVEEDAKDFLRPSYLTASRRNNKITDLFISSNSIQTEEYKRAFLCQSEIMQCGIPRNDIYFKITNLQISNIKRAIGVDTEVKLVLYAPTFRDIDSGASYSLDGIKLIETLETKTHEKWKLLVRFHPAVREKDYDQRMFLNDDIINMTSYPDMQELLIICNLVITDISSSIYDCTLLRRPLFLFMPDFDFYQKNCRGLTDEFYCLPYKIHKSNDELWDAIRLYNDDEMRDIQNAYIKRVNGADDGHSAEKIVQKLESYLSSH